MYNACSFSSLMSHAFLFILIHFMILNLLIIFMHVYNLLAQVQLTVCQQLLTVELLQFYNMYNAEVISGSGFCCCDKSKCTQQLEYLPSCKPKCDTWFNVSLSPCQSPHSCSTATAAQCQSASLQKLEYKFEFVMCNAPYTVSLNKLYIVTFVHCF